MCTLEFEFGYIFSKLRARLSLDNVNKLVFLARNENLYLEVRLEFCKHCLNMQTRTCVCACVRVCMHIGGWVDGGVGWCAR